SRRRFRRSRATPSGRPGGGIAIASLTGLDAPAAVRFMGARCRGWALSLDDICPVCLGGYVARVIVDVMLKPEIHDPQGEAVLGALHRPGFGTGAGGRQGKVLE